MNNGLKAAAASLVVTIGLMACVRGGGDTSSSASAPAPIALKTSTIRTLQPNDTWSYAGTGIYSSGGSAVNIAATVSDTILSSAKQDPITSINCLDEFITISLLGPSGVPTLISSHNYESQDASGTIYVHGENTGSGDIWVNAESGSKYIALRSPMASNQRYGTSVAYSEGTTATTTQQVSGVENVNTTAGYYQAYRILENAAYTDTNGTGSVESNTVWYVPGLGVVKETMNVTYYTENTIMANLTLTFSLTNTSVIY